MKPYIRTVGDDTEELLVDADTGRVIPVGDGPPQALDRTPIVTARRLRHGLAAVLIPRGLTREAENQLRTALGLTPRTTTRKDPA